MSEEKENTNQEEKESDLIAEVSTAAKRSNILEEVFSTGAKLITLPGSSLVVDADTRRLLALFSDGTYLVTKGHEFDGHVLSFEALARRKKLLITKPRLVSANELSAVYSFGERKQISEEDDVADEQQLQMQKDFVNVINRAALKKVSDIHVVVANSTGIYFRTNGMMQQEMEYNKDWGEAFVRAAFASSDVSDSNYAQNEFQGAQKSGATPLRGSGGKLMLPHNVLAIRLQFNPIAFGSQYLVMRLLYADDNPDGSGDLGSLGLTKAEQDLFYRLRAAPVGLSIIAGPTGSGKSTTLQRNMIKMLQEKRYEINLITVEDPPEYPIPGARQMPVTNANTEEEKEEQFTKALSAALRSDPDCMMVGEIRTYSAAELTFKGALSGHNMWSTLHANSAPAIVTRLRDMGIQTYMLNDPELVKGLVSQRLFRKLCPQCRISVKQKLGEPMVKRLKVALGDYGMDNVYLRGPGCKNCKNTGFVGRISVPEIILPDAKFLELMIKNETRQAIDYWTSELGGRPLRDAATERMLRGLIDLEELERWCGLLDQKPVY